MRGPIYVSYAPADAGIARLLKETLHSGGIATIERNPGAIPSADKFLFCVTCDEDGGPRFNASELEIARTAYRQNAQADWLIAFRATCANVTIPSDDIAQVIEIPWIEVVAPIAQELSLSREPRADAEATLDLGEACIDGDTEITNRDGPKGGGSAVLDMRAKDIQVGGKFTFVNVRNHRRR